ncbi:Uma2 family endonuclease [Leptolyngbya sp. NK1-12]|uniref:Uma2 family endonuclease n=1 Tax=Leptolyngbya sp. NK1-12 TaxID=2547451 RepID=UPI00292EBCC5|nr:Uma2 family endonuclease [Leptolyngbya sp. NK1-12]
MELSEAGGIEPDYCFYIDNWQAAVGHDHLQWGRDPAPDLVIEIDVTTYTDANDYAAYNVPEVWLLQKNRHLAIYGLEVNAYQPQTTSRYFPEFDLPALVAECLTAASEQGTGAAIRQLRQRLATNLDTVE